MAHHDRITPPPREELRALILGGMKRDQLDAHYGVSRSTVDKWKRDYKLQHLAIGGAKKKDLPISTIRSMADAGMALPAMARELGCCIELVLRHMNEHGIKTVRQIKRVQPERQAVVNVVPSRRALFAANPFGLNAHEAHF